jgi:hypothetical protein
VLYYVARTKFGISEDEFWRSTFRQLFAMVEIHNRGMQPEKQEKYIDEVI